VVVDDGAGAIGSCPRSVLGVTAGDGAGAIGATGFGRAIGLETGVDTGFMGAAFFGACLDAALFGAARFGAALLGAAFFATAFLGAAFLAFLATLALLALFAGRAFFFAVLFLAAARLVFACGRFFPLAFFFAMVSHLLGVNPIIVRVAPKKSAVICARCWSRRCVLRTLPS
jgi:hypothetical protein